MKAKSFILDIKRLIWHPLTIILLLLSTTSAMGQIDYHAHPQKISNKDSIVSIEWLMSSPQKCPIDFNHLVNFINTKSETITNSKVTVELYHNEKLVRDFVFPVGDGIANRIYTFEPINLRKGDHVYFIFKLSPTTDDEEYVFNIYEEKRVSSKTITSIKPTAERITATKEFKPRKTKKHSIGWIGRNVFRVQEPIGREF